MSPLEVEDNLVPLTFRMQTIPSAGATQSPAGLREDSGGPPNGSRQKVTVDDIVRAIPFGRFQILMILIFHLIYSAPSIVVYNYAFFLLYPSYLCKDSASGEWVHCSREQMCASTLSFRNRTMGMGPEDMEVEGVFESQVDWQNQYSLRNWITRLNLDCRGDALIISLFGSYEFFGQLVACMVFPPLADLFGRKLFTFIGMGLQTFVFIGLIAFKKY